MPVIIDEVVISVEMAEERAGPSAGPLGPEERQALIQECVERVLDALHQREER
jgi:hypothetical protein